MCLTRDYLFWMLQEEEDYEDDDEEVDVGYHDQYVDRLGDYQYFGTHQYFDVGVF